MDVRTVVQLRRSANGLAGPPRSGPVEVVRSLLAVQSQDVSPSAWSIAQRLAGGTEAQVERARADGRLVRSHVLRTTWHDVCTEDLRWLLRLTGPRVLAQLVRVRRELALDDEVLRTARRALEPALAAAHLTRAEVAAVLAAHGLVLDGRALGHLLMLLELELLVCSGVRRGRAQTWALVDERVAPAGPRDHGAAVAELVLRFLTGHGPAAARDVSWWSSLLVRDVRAALAGLGDAVWSETVDGIELWRARDAPPLAGGPPVQLVQLYDEHLVAFTATKHYSDPTRATSTRTRPFLGVVLVDGVFAGSWGRTAVAGGTRVDVELDSPQDDAALAAAAEPLATFLGTPVTVVQRA